MESQIVWIEKRMDVVSIEIASLHDSECKLNIAVLKEYIWLHEHLTQLQDDMEGI